MLKFGKKYNVGNYYLLKKNKTLSKKEIGELRDEIGIPKEFRENLRRDGVPVIVVSSVSGHWRVEYMPMLRMYQLLDDIELDENDEVVDVEMLDTLFSMIYANATVLGDEEFYASIKECYVELLKRVKDKGISKEDDDKILDSMKKDMEHEENMTSIAKDIDKENEKRKKKRRNTKV